MTGNPPIVVDADARPAGKPGECFYCQRRVGSEHKAECVLWTRRVVLRATIEYTEEVPHAWDAHMIQFARNEGSWCADNIVGDLEKHVKFVEGLHERDIVFGCLCSFTKVEYVREWEEPKEGGA